MKLVYNGKIISEFNGFNYKAIFELDNGITLRQKNYKYRYIYRYMPKAKLWIKGSSYYLEIENINEMIEVEKID